MVYDRTKIIEDVKTARRNVADAKGAGVDTQYNEDLIEKTIDMYHITDEELAPTVDDELPFWD